MAKIPGSVLKLLSENEWRLPEKDYSAFDSVWNDDSGDEYRNRRRLDPSFYFFYKNSLDRVNNGLSGNEVKSLAPLEMLSGLIKEDETFYAVNEHALHAMLDFCESVYGSWDILLKRLRTVNKTA